MIIDSFLYAGERDMLELRLRTLAPVVDQFIAVVCTHSHQGQQADSEQITTSFYRARETYYDASPGTASVALHIFRPDMSGWPKGARGGAGTPEYQKIERQHRDSCLDAVRTVTDDPDTVVLVSDVDEIPMPEYVALIAKGWLQDGCPWWTFGLRNHSTALDLLHPLQPWWGTTISRLSDCRPQEMRDARTTLNDPPTATILGVGGSLDRPVGIHCSWFGTDEERQRKLETFSHAELAHVDLAQQRRDGLHVNGEQLVRCEFPDPSLWYPKPLLDGTFTIPESWRA